ncbi:C40 family peptidase [Klebsiella aerogenes]|uniref:C40 family peptidase n=1 Tax=Klebsiella aerogenes TaxID=548 RepID=UPI001F2BE8FB|nr:NlpC/P60 family protein [Klebsiella aerogenes]
MNASYATVVHHSTFFNIRKMAPVRQDTGTVRETLLAHYRDWQGTPYLWGGSGHHGIDCSALMQHLVQEIAHYSLPRTTTGQITRGQRVSVSRLKPGDLIFFRTGVHQKHVGMYVGKGQFVHASSSKGVTLSRLNNPYWQSRWLDARRLDAFSAHVESLAS